MSISLESIKRWGIKGGFGVLDQTIFSGTNFLLGILLARWISPEMYGAFSSSYSIFLLLSTFQVALIAEPMSIFGAGKYSGKVIPYLNYLLRIQWLGALAGTILIVVSSLVFAKGAIQNAMLAMAVSLPCILFYWYLRRAFYIEAQSKLAAITSLMYSAVLVIIILLLEKNGGMSILKAYLALALSSITASVFAMRRLGIRFLGIGAGEGIVKHEKVNKELWEFGQWIMPAYLAGWLTSFSFPFFVSVLINIQSAGAFRAIQNLFLPIQQFLAVITLLTLPWLAKQHEEGGRPRTFSIIEVVALFTGLSVLLYCVLVVTFKHELSTFLYRNEFYSSFDYLVNILAFSFFISSVPLVLGLALRVIARPKIILWSKVGAVVFTVFIGLPMIWMMKMNGVVISIVGAAAIEAFVLLFCYFRVKSLSRIQYYV